MLVFFLRLNCKESIYLRQVLWLAALFVQNYHDIGTSDQPLGRIHSLNLNNISDQPLGRIHSLNLNNTLDQPLGRIHSLNLNNT